MSPARREMLLQGLAKPGREICAGFVYIRCTWALQQLLLESLTIKSVLFATLASLLLTTSNTGDEVTEEPTTRARAHRTMAKVGHVREFDMQHPERWPSYLNRVKGFLRLNKVTEDEDKAAALLSVSGSDVHDIAEDLCAPEEVDTLSFDELCDLLTKHFRPKRSEMYWRLEFQKRMQLPGESTGNFITAVRHAARSCKFPDLEDRLRDQICTGLADELLKADLLSRPDMDLQELIDRALAYESVTVKRVQKQQEASTIHQIDPAGSLLTGADEDAEINVLTARLARLKAQRDRGLVKQAYSRAPASRPPPPPPSSNQAACASCGGPHQRSNCRFRTAKCHICGKTGHIQAVCRSKARGRVNDVEAVDPGKIPRWWMGGRRPRPLLGMAVQAAATINSNFCGPKRATASNSGEDPPLKPKFVVQVELNGVPCPMEIDSGSSVSIMSKTTFKHICARSNKKIPLTPTRVRIKDFQKNPIKMLGRARLHVKYHKFSKPLEILVTEGERTSLIGLDWFDELGLWVGGVHEVGLHSLEDVCNEFADVFEDKLGTFKGPPISLKLKQDVEPVRLKARKVPFALKEKIEAELERLVGLGVITPVDGGVWETPIVTPVKPNGQLRICADYRATVNKALSPHAYPVPSVKHVLASIQKGAIFASLDLAQAYFQLPVSPETAAIQTIVTHKGAFQINRLQFGISVAPGIFQEAMERTLKGVPGTCPYFDDVLIAGEDEQQLAARLKLVLTRFREFGLQLKREKCKIGVKSTEFLGFRIDAQGIHPTDAKIRAIKLAPTPKNKAELQAFLGLVNFYHIFIPHKAAIAEPLHRLLDKGAKWQWGRTQAHSFTQLKQILTSNTTVTHFIEGKPLCLACDASPYGIGAVLSHVEENGQHSPVAYYSRTMSPTERNYAQIDKEALAIVASVKKFHDYLFGREFDIFTDHKPLLGLLAADKQTPQIMSPRMLRWSIFLSAYSYSLHYRPGRQMGHADALSRLPLPEIEPDPAPAGYILHIETMDNAPLTVADIEKYTRSDPVLSRVAAWVATGWPAHSPGPQFTPFHSRRDELSLHRGCVLWGSRVVIPSKLASKVLDTLHEAHPGIVRMKALARSYLWWPGLDKAIEQRVAVCHRCQSNRPEQSQAPIHKWETTQTPWSRIHIDFAGPFQGKTFLIVIDSHSKWLEVVPVEGTTTAITIRVLRSLFATHGLPDVLVSDNGPQFTASDFQSFTRVNCIRHITSAPYHASSNGLAERMVRATKDALRTIVDGDWHQRLARFLLAQHTTPCTSTGKSPAEMRWGRRLTTRLDRLHPDRSIPQPEPPAPTKGFENGACIWLRNYSSGEKWVPGVVIHQTGPVSYLVEGIEGRQFRRHIDQLRKRVQNDQGEPSVGSAADSIRSRETQSLMWDQHLGTSPAARGTRDGGPNGVSERSCPESPTLFTPSEAGPTSPAPLVTENPLQRKSSRTKKPPAYLQDYVHK